jgi:hypothetical protein
MLKISFAILAAKKYINFRVSLAGKTEIQNSKFKAQRNYSAIF